MKTILVVDDEFDMTSTLRAILEGEGHRVETSANGREALERMKAAKPDLVLLDVMMPIQGGYELLRTMRQTPGLDGVPVVLMSSVPPLANREEYRWQEFLRKPFTLNALLQTVERAIGKADFAAEGR